MFCFTFLFNLVMHGHGLMEQQCTVRSYTYVDLHTRIRRHTSAAAETETEPEPEPECLFSFQNFAKFFKIPRHIESLDTCMKH